MFSTIPTNSISEKHKNENQWKFWKEPRTIKHPNISRSSSTVHDCVEHEAPNEKKINFDFSLPQFIKRVPFIDSSWICAGESENYFSMDSKMKLRTFQCLQNKQYFDIFYVS